MAKETYWKVWLTPNRLTKDIENDFVAEVSTAPLCIRRFLCSLLFFLFALTAAEAQAKDTLAILPFTGAQGTDGETIAELFSFQKGLTAVFSPVPRTSINRAIRGEQGFQMESGMTDPDTIASLGKQLGATYVVAGTITKLGDQNLLIIAILHTENLQQIAGDIQTYRTIEEIDEKLFDMAWNVAAAVKTDTSKLPFLALPPVQLAGGADSREADALAQILAVNLIRSGKYAVYPRTKSLEQVQEEYGNQFDGDTADEYLPNIGRADNPRLVLSVTARRLGNRNMFNAAIINLETGIQEAGDTVNYQSLNDGMKAMEELALRLTDPDKVAMAKAARLVAEGERQAAERARAQAEQERLVAAAKAATLVVSNVTSFTQAIAAINSDSTGGSYTITLSNSFNSNPVSFTGSTFTGYPAKTITIKGDANVRTISNNGGRNLFYLPEGITLVLDNNVTLNGNNKEYHIVDISGGALSMKSGSTVRGSKKGGVWVLSGTFTMSGGNISGNSASFGGGGVFVDGGTFTMSGGTISGNTASLGGGVSVSYGTFTMSGGAISGNTSSSSGGGGVAVYKGTFTMSGGTISGNTTSSPGFGGGGVAMSDGTFTMSGGTISGNTTALGSFGGGVDVSGGMFVKSGGGTIDNTNSAQHGKVVFVSDGYKQRDTTAGPGVNLDSRVPGSAGGWE
ncbi:MAG: penicillin-binding protein activator LpoB [Treponema sp.]|jgi:TolB-like protein|nr:penicillin-binding protein activator LpoB [Treponema sp.]